VVDGGEPEIVVNEDVASVDPDYIDQEADRPRVPLDGRTLIVVDDGIATGVSVRAAFKALRAEVS
jgi:predicted phosphoribosyltransferase